MGIISILFGLVVLLGFVGLGFIVANYIISNPLLLSTVGLAETNSTLAHTIIIGIFALIGLMIFMNLLMNGLIYNRIMKGQREERERRARREHRRMRESED